MNIESKLRETWDSWRSRARSGHGVKPGAPTYPPAPRPPLRRSRPNSAEMPVPLLGGVCAGLAVHLGVPVRMVRIVLVASSLFFGSGLILYLWLWMTVPLDDLSGSKAGGAEGGKPARLSTPLAKVDADRRPQMVSGQLLLAGGAFLVLAVFLVLAQSWLNLSMSTVVSCLLILGGLILAWMQVPKLAQWKSPKVLSLVGSGVALVVMGIVSILAQGQSWAALLSGALFGIILVVGILVALAPIWFKALGNLSDARTNEAREAERADMAAHLHDSVLQTLTLIRASAGDPLRVRALALTQERELRSWLYTGHEEAGTSIAQALRDQVGGVESTYGEEIAVVTVGDTVPGPAELAAVAAAGEATTNAVRHGVPPVSVYLELSPECVEIFVKDAGEGFDISAIPEDRHGVRDSIQGRIERVGGTTQIRTRAEGIPGTEVRIRVPRTDSAFAASQQDLDSLTDLMKEPYQ